MDKIYQYEITTQYMYSACPAHNSCDLPYTFVTIVSTHVTHSVHICNTVSILTHTLEFFTTGQHCLVSAVKALFKVTSNLGIAVVFIKPAFRVYPIYWYANCMELRHASIVKILSYNHNVLYDINSLRSWVDIINIVHCILQCVCKTWLTGTGFNIKMIWQSRYSLYKDKTVSRPSYLYNRNPYTWKDDLYIETWP